MIKFENVNFAYGKYQIIKDINFVVNPGECLVLAGMNGSGKTTILKLIANIIKKDFGKIYVKGEIGYIPQGVTLFSDMTVKDNMNFFYSIKKEKLPKELPFLLNEYRKVKICKLSGGIAKITSIACALAGDPENILYDEPCANLDVVYANEIKKIIMSQKENKKSILYAGHLYDEFCDFYDKLLFIDKNKCVLYNKNELNKEKYLLLFT